MDKSRVLAWQTELTYALPLPGHGDTLRRWRQLARWGAQDLALAKLLEAHWDAVAILADLGRPPPDGTAALWGVWAAQDPAHPLIASERAGAWRLSGSKPWCSGFRSVTHALVTAQSAADESAPPQRHLLAVDLAHPSVQFDAAGWIGLGMQAIPTAIASFEQTPAVRIGAAADYLERSGFWHGAAGVAVCWWGGASACAGKLQRALKPDQPHAAARLGQVAALLAAAQHSAAALAARIDTAPEEAHVAEVLAFRSLVKRVALETMAHVNDALGPAALSGDREHAQRCVDLQLWTRQHHSGDDEAVLGRLIHEQEFPWTL